MNGRRRVAAAVLAVVAVGVLAWAPGRELRVPDEYPTIGAAIEAASDGDTIRVAPGTYRVNLVIAKRVTLVGADRDTAVLDGGGSDVVTVASGGALVLKSLTVTNGREGVSVRRGGQVRIEGCRVSGNARDGVLAMGTAELLGTVIYGNGRCGVNAFGGDARVTGGGNVIANNAEDLSGTIPPEIRIVGGPPAPVVRVTPDTWTNRNEFTVRWESPVYPAAIVAAWYKVGAAPAGPEDGTRTTTASLTLGIPAEGRQPVYLWLEDELGQKNHGNAAQTALLWDKTPPTITATVDPKPNDHGWNRTAVTVTFRAEDSHSGVATLTPRDPVRVTAEGKDQVAKAVAVDHAGNRSERAVTVHIDLTGPQVSVGQPQGTLGSEGWYRSAVTVPYTATDGLSGFAGGKTRTEGTATTTGEGADLRVTIRVTDLAGNTAEASAGPFKVDTTPPVVRATPPEASRWYREDVAVPCTASDATSGLASAADASFTLVAKGEGAAVATEARTVADKAGNTATVGPFRFQIDRTPPTGTLKIDDGAATTGNSLVTLTLSGTDATSGVAEMRFSNDGSTWSSWEPFATSRPGWDLTQLGGSPAEGTKAVHAQLRDRAGNVSAAFTASIRYAVPPPPPGMVLIPAGSFRMGDAFNEGDSYERPVHTVYVSAFYMDRYEVTKALWDEVASWAQAHGYDIKPSDGSGKAPNHPVYNVSWYEAVKWCNARSEKEGRTPAYYTSGAKTTVYRTGMVDVQNDWVRWDTGYRLPTEAEWEKAARGGCEGHRFPWCDTDTIGHSRANYFSSSSRSYDTGPTRGYHPTYKTGSEPYTSPVGSFAPNGYGLYDMAGNVGEWCWDLYSSTYYASSPGTDPRGPASGASRAIRGGSWGADAFSGRVASRLLFGPSNESFYLGFRAVLPLSSPGVVDARPLTRTESRSRPPRDEKGRPPLGLVAGSDGLANAPAARASGWALASPSPAGIG